MAAIPGLGGGLMPQDTNVTGAAPGRRFRCSDEMKASAVLLTSLGRGCTVTHYTVVLQTKAIRRFVITEKAPTRAFSWLNAATTAFTFKTLSRHYAKSALTPRSLNSALYKTL